MARSICVTLGPEAYHLWQKIPHGSKSRFVEDMILEKLGRRRRTWELEEEPDEVEEFIRTWKRESSSRT